MPEPMTQVFQADRGFVLFTNDVKSRHLGELSSFTTNCSLGIMMHVYLYVTGAIIPAIDMPYMECYNPCHRYALYGVQ